MSYLTIAVIWLGFFALLGYTVKEKCEDALDAFLVMTFPFMIGMFILLFVTAGIITSFK